MPQTRWQGAATEPARTHLAQVAFLSCQSSSFLGYIFGKAVRTTKNPNAKHNRPQNVQPNRRAAGNRRHGKGVTAKILGKILGKISAEILHNRCLIGHSVCHHIQFDSSTQIYKFAAPSSHGRRPVTMSRLIYRRLACRTKLPG